VRAECVSIQPPLSRAPSQGSGVCRRGLPITCASGEPLTTVVSMSDKPAGPLEAHLEGLSRVSRASVIARALGPVHVLRACRTKVGARGSARRRRR
jgi:hypothetical protein